MQSSELQATVPDEATLREGVRIESSAMADDVTFSTWNLKRELSEGLQTREEREREREREERERRERERENRKVYDNSCICI